MASSTDIRKLRHGAELRLALGDIAGGAHPFAEIDGSFHMRVEHWTRDMKRERAEVISGRTVLRCSSIEVRLQPGDVLDDLQSVGVPTRFVPEASA